MALGPNFVQRWLAHQRGTCRIACPFPHPEREATTCTCAEPEPDSIGECRHCHRGVVG